MVTSLAGGPVDGVDVCGENHRNVNTRSNDKRHHNDARFEDAVQTPKSPKEHGKQDVPVLTLAEQFIAAMPDYIKNENSGSHDNIIESSVSMEVLDDLSSSVSLCCYNINSKTNTEFNEHAYYYRQRDHEIETPTSSTSISPISSVSQCSPASPPTAADLCEFLHASSNNQPFENNFSDLTLSDHEQRELYEAAKTIQKAYRTYKKKEEDKEISAASVIQNYFRRYKQYVYYKKMTKAAVLIQNRYRLYRRYKRFKKEELHFTNDTSNVIKKIQIQKQQHQAARKIQQFIRQSKNGTPPQLTINECTSVSRKREYNSNHNLKYPPTKVAQYSSIIP